MKISRILFLLTGGIGGAGFVLGLGRSGGGGLPLPWWRKEVGFLLLGGGAGAGLLFTLGCKQSSINTIARKHENSFQNLLVV